MEKSDAYTILAIAAGVAAIAVASYLIVRPRPTFVSFTRDESGRVIEIIEKPL